MPEVSAARREVAATLVDHLGRGRSALLVALPGHGLTTCLRAVATASGAAWIAGRESVDEPPFLPFAALLAEHGLSGAGPLATFSSLPGSLLARRTRLVVDDAEHLDARSSVLLAQTCRAGVPVVFGVSRTAALPEALRDVALALPQQSVTPLEPEEVERLAAALAGGRLDPPSASALWRRSRGVPVVVVDLVSTALAREEVRPTAAGLHLTAFHVGADSLHAVGVDDDLLGRHRTVLHLLAVAGPLPVEVLDPAALRAATAERLVSDDGVRADVSSPLVADWSLAQLSPERRAALSLQAVGLLAGRPDDQAHAQVLLTLGGRAGGATPEVAAQWLGRRDRREEALALLDHGATTAPDPTRRGVARADALASLGRITDAVEALDDAARTATGQGVVDVVLGLTTLLGGGGGDDALSARVEALAARIEDADVRSEVAAALGRRRVVQGAARPGSSDDPLAALLRESLTGSLAAARDGAGTLRLHGATEGEGASLDHHLRVLIHCLSLAYDGQLVEAREIAEQEYATARRHSDPVLGLWSYNRTKIAFHAGQHARAVELGDGMLLDLAWRDPFGLHVSGLALHAAALARCGRTEEAETLAAGLAGADLELPRARLGVARVRAQRHLADGDRAGAAAVLAEAGRYAIAHDEAHSGLLGLDEAFWVDPVEAAADEIAGFPGTSGLARVLAERARAFARADVTALEGAAGELELMVQPGRAAATWLNAATLRGAAAGPGDSASAHEAERAHRRAVRLEVHWGCSAWPVAALVSPLTDRELDVARRAASRLRSREIADELGLSSRTVDNYLARVFRKTGVRNREELAEVLGLSSR